MKNHEERRHIHINNSIEDKENTADSNNNGNENNGDSSYGPTENSFDVLEGEGAASDNVLPEVRVVEEKLAETQDRYCLLYTSDAADE